MDMIRPHVEWIAPMEVMAGEFEMEALAAGGLRVLRGEEKAHDFVWNREMRCQLLPKSAAHDVECGCRFCAAHGRLK